jgi:hypothetical protein
MDLTNMTDVGLVSVIIVQGCSLLALWLRLRWHVRQEVSHREYVVAVLQALPEDTKIDDERENGVRLTITRQLEGGDGRRA